MKPFLLALQFLTSLPVRVKTIADGDLSRALIFFPLVGLLLGVFLGGAGYLMDILGLQPILISVILVVALVVASGGLHLDGLADTFDALLSGRRDREGMLAIMRDSRIGAMGVLALVCVLLLKVALLFSIGRSLRTASLVLMCVLSRWSQVLSLYLFPYARDEGRAKAFVDALDLKITSIAAVLALAISILIWQVKGLSLAAAAVMSTYLIGNFLRRKLGGVTGDTVGMTSELLEVITLFAVLIAERI